MHSQPYTWKAPHKLLVGPEEVCETDAQVIALWPDFGQVWLKTSEGHQLAITARTEGVDWRTLHEGQNLHCIFTVKLPRVLLARVIG